LAVFIYLLYFVLHTAGVSHKPQKSRDVSQLCDDPDCRKHSAMDLIKDVRQEKGFSNPKIVFRVLT
jgi:hypothetical protein